MKNKCPWCGAETLTPEELNEHLYSVHGYENRVSSKYQQTKYQLLYTLIVIDILIFTLLIIFKG